MLHRIPAEIPVPALHFTGHGHERGHEHWHGGHGYVYGHGHGNGHAQGMARTWAWALGRSDFHFFAIFGILHTPLDPRVQKMTKQYFCFSHFGRIFLSLFKKGNCKGKF